MTDRPTCLAARQVHVYSAGYLPSEASVRAAVTAVCGGTNPMPSCEGLLCFTDADQQTSRDGVSRKPWQTNPSGGYVPRCGSYAYSCTNGCCDGIGKTGPVCAGTGVGTR